METIKSTEVQQQHTPNPKAQIIRNSIPSNATKRQKLFIKLLKGYKKQIKEARSEGSTKESERRALRKLRGKLITATLAQITHHNIRMMLQQSKQARSVTM